MLRRRPCDYTGAHLRRGCAARRDPVAVHRVRRTAGAALRRRHFNTDPATARRTARTCHRAPPSTEEEYSAKEPRGRAFLHAATTSRRPRTRATSTRCCSPPAARSTTSTRAPRPAGHRSSRPPRPTYGSSSVAATPLRSASRRATACGRVAAGRGRGAGARRPDPCRRRLRSVPLRVLGPDAGRRRAANELTITSWDPVSKQPLFKVAAARVRKA